MTGSSLALSPRRLRALERTLFAFALILLGWYGLERALTVYEQAVSNREFEETRLASAGRTELDAQQRLAAGALVGRVEVPRIGLSAIVREGDDPSTLRRAVGHIPQTPLPGAGGNAGLAGHRDTFFHGLGTVRRGDRIVVTTADAVLHYDVASTRIVDPSEVSVLAPTPRPSLTLVTCYPFNYIGAAPQRFIVRANLTAIGDNKVSDARGIQTDDSRRRSGAPAVPAALGLVARRTR